MEMDHLPLEGEELCISGTVRKLGTDEASSRYQIYLLHGANQLERKCKI
jgi:hypothetical protein